MKFVALLFLLPAMLFGKVHDYKDTKSHGFENEKLYLLDHRKDAFLFRGNLPQKDGAFAQKELHDAMTVYLDKMNIMLPSEYIFVDVSLLNPKKEKKKINIEKNWFKDSPEKGMFLSHPLRGTHINPCMLNHELRNFLIEKDHVDGLQHLMTRLNNYMLVRRDIPLVVYVHCAAGVDRTGEASASYMMQYKGMSFHDAVKLNDHIAKRPVHYLMMNAIRWYAYYLRDVLHIETVGEIK
jgi:hypothetical protein